MKANATGSGWLLLIGFAVSALGLAQEGEGDPPVVTDGGTPFLTTPGYGTADSNGSMIAVTGLDITGSSILYLVDTENRQLAVYQANGGSSSTMGLKFVAGRNIDLDLQVRGYNDQSEYSYSELLEQFEKAENR
ncbi:MAG: hypothetical protein AAF682_18640 [Planctomycetota bacterium]